LEFRRVLFRSLLRLSCSFFSGHVADCLYFRREPGHWLWLSPSKNRPSASEKISIIRAWFIAALKPRNADQLDGRLCLDGLSIWFDLRGLTDLCREQRIG